LVNFATLSSPFLSPESGRKLCAAGLLAASAALDGLRRRQQRANPRQAGARGSRANPVTNDRLLPAVTRSIFIESITARG